MQFFEKVFFLIRFRIFRGFSFWGAITETPNYECAEPHVWRPEIQKRNEENGTQHSPIANDWNSRAHGFTARPFAK